MSQDTRPGGTTRSSTCTLPNSVLQARSRTERLCFETVSFEERNGATWCVSGSEEATFLSRSALNREFRFASSFMRCSNTSSKVALTYSPASPPDSLGKEKPSRDGFGKSASDCTKMQQQGLKRLGCLELRVSSSWGRGMWTWKQGVGLQRRPNAYVLFP